MKWRTLCLAVAVVSLAGCGDDDAGRREHKKTCDADGSYAPQLDPANFVATIDNPFLPWTPGTVFTYEGGDETIVVTVTNDTRVVMGVTTTVVRDTATVDGDVTEDTFDWYAQDADGNVWYFGEDTTEFDGDETSKAGSWEAGIDGAQPGIVMLANPVVGSVYRQEFLACEAEDMGEVVGLDEDISVPAGDFTGCVRTRDYTRLELTSNEYKWYCPDVGQVSTVDIWTGAREDLVSITP
jgi:hypothetical protein